MELTPIIVVPTIFYFTYKALESLIRRKERMMLVEKLDLSTLHTLPSLQSLANVLDFMPNKRFSNLRAGMLISGIGLGLLVAWVLAITLFPIVASYKQSMGNEFYKLRNAFDAIYIAAPALFGGIGLLISYMIEQKARKQE